MLASTFKFTLLLVACLFVNMAMAQPPDGIELPSADEIQIQLDDEFDIEDFDMDDFDVEDFDMEGFDGADFSSEPSTAELIIGLACYGVVILGFLGIWIAILLLFSKSLASLPEQHRLMPPGHVWLLLIPLFNIVWMFFVFTRIPKSFRSYFSSVGRTDVGDCGEQIGLWYCICAVTSAIPCIGIIPGIASLILLIMFIVKVVDLKGKVSTVGNQGMVQ